MSNHLYACKDNACLLVQQGFRFGRALKFCVKSITRLPLLDFALFEGLSFGPAAQKTRRREVLATGAINNIDVSRW